MASEGQVHSLFFIRSVKANGFIGVHSCPFVVGWLCSSTTHGHQWTRMAGVGFLSVSKTGDRHLISRGVFAKSRTRWEEMRSQSPLFDRVPTKRIVRRTARHDPDRQTIKFDLKDY